MSNVQRQYIPCAQKVLCVHLETGNSMNDTEVNKTISQMVRYVVCRGVS